MNRSLRDQPDRPTRRPQAARLARAKVAEHRSPHATRSIRIPAITLWLICALFPTISKGEPPANPPAAQDNAQNQAQHEEQNQPDASEIVDLDWTAVNTSASLNLDSGQTHYTIRLSGKVEVPAETSILAVSHLVALEHAIDRLGRNLLTSEDGKDTQPAGVRNVRHFNGIQPPDAADGVSTVHVTAMLNGVDNLPRFIRSLRGSVPVLLCRSTTTIELDNVAAMDDDKEVSDRVAIRILEVGREDGAYEVRLKWRLKHDPNNQNTYYSNLRMIRHVVIKDDAGNRIQGEPGKRSAFRRTREMSEGEMSFRFALPPDRQAATLDAEIVTRIETSAFTIQAENIPMPGSHSTPGV